ncbi:MAG: hypothetical protein HUJ91_07390 [Bacteroidales bacterium]|nr:hypothetical protein [Bacteroidales bacterium]
MKRIHYSLILMTVFLLFSAGAARADAQDIEYVVRATTLEIFEEASIASKVIGQFKCGDNPHVTVNNLDIPMYQVRLNNGKLGYICSAGTRVAGDLPPQYTDGTPQEYDEDVSASKEFMKTDPATMNSKDGYYTGEFVDMPDDYGQAAPMGVKERLQERANDTRWIIRLLKWTAIILLVVLFFSIYVHWDNVLFWGLIVLGIVETLYVLMPGALGRKIFSQEIFFVIQLFLLLCGRLMGMTPKRKTAMIVNLVFLVASLIIAICKVGIYNAFASAVGGILNLLVGALVGLAIYGMVKDADQPSSPSKSKDEWDGEAMVNGHRVYLRDIGGVEMRGDDGKTYRRVGGGNIEEVTYNVFPVDYDG